jgi:hypothetical protein
MEVDDTLIDGPPPGSTGFMGMHKQVLERLNYHAEEGEKLMPEQLTLKACQEYEETMVSCHEEGRGPDAIAQYEQDLLERLHGRVPHGYTQADVDRLK